MATEANDSSTFGVATVEESPQGKLFGIRAITVFSHWLDEFTMANSAIIMAFAILAIVADAMLASKLLGYQGFVLAAVAIITALGTETQARTMLRRGKMAWDANKIGTAIFWWVVTAPIAVMLFVTVWMWFLEHTENVSESIALGQLGISYWAFTQARAAIFVFLFVMSGVNYYLPPQQQKRKVADVERDMHEQIRLAPTRARLAEAMADARAIEINAKQRIDAANLRRVRNAGQAAFKGVHAVTDYQEQPDFAASVASYQVNNPVSLVPAQQPPVQLVQYQSQPHHRVRGDDDTLPPTTPPNGPKRRPGRPRTPVRDILANTPAPQSSSVSGPLGGTFNAAEQARRTQIDSLKGWLKGMSQALARGEIVSEPTAVDAHQYLLSCGNAPKTAPTSRKRLVAAIAELEREGVSLEWPQLAAAQG